jgi:hypothetical protein
MHKIKLCSKSKFFRAACSKRWIEGQEKTVRLPDVKIELFRHYCEWICSGTIPANRVTTQSDTKELNAEHKLLIGLYLLGDSLDDLQLRNLATQRFCKCLQEGNSLPICQAYVDIWSSTPSSSLFRKQLVDIVVGRLNRDKFAEMIAEYPAEWVRELAVAAMRKAPTLTWETVVGDNTKYLESEEAEDSNT